MTVQITPWTLGEEVTAGGLRTYTQTGRVDVFVATGDVDGTNVWLDPPSLPALWLELDNYNGPWAAISYPKGHIVDHAALDGTVLWYVATTATRGGDIPGESPSWLLFGGRRTPAIPPVELCETRWRSPITIHAPRSAVATGINLTEPPAGGQLLIRMEPPADGSATEEALIPVGELLALTPAAIGDELAQVPAGARRNLSGRPLESATLLARTAENMLLVQLPQSETTYPTGQAARLTFAHDAAWPALFFAAATGDVAFDTTTHGELSGTLTAPVRARLAPTPTPETRGRYVRQSPDAETYELTVEAPLAGTDAYVTAEQYRERNANPEGEDDLVAAVLLAVSRHLDRALGYCPGGLGPIDERSMTFWPQRRPSRVLRPRDSEGHLWPIRAVTSIAVDYSGSGTPDATWNLTDQPWIVGQPHGGRPWRALRILESHRDAAYATWPTDPGSVTIAATYGHPTIEPAAIELVTHVAREVLDGHAGGAAAIFAALDSGSRLAATPAGTLAASISSEADLRP